MAKMRGTMTLILDRGADHPLEPPRAIESGDIDVPDTCTGDELTRAEVNALKRIIGKLISDQRDNELKNELIEGLQQGLRDIAVEVQTALVRAAH